MIYASYSHCGVIRKRTSHSYFVGGRDSAQPTMSTGTQVFDPETGIFSAISAQLSVGRVLHACAVYEKENLLITAGGYNSQWQLTDSVEILNLKSESWTTDKSMPIKGKVWAVGEVLLTWKTELYQYHPGSNQWLEIDDVPFALSDLKEGFKAVDVEGTNICSFI